MIPSYPRNFKWQFNSLALCIGGVQLRATNQQINNIK
nr:MAG TPA: hypothetical protein [Caudoviricetes sp.]